VGLPVAFAVGFPGGAVGLWLAFPAGTVAGAVGDGVGGTVVGGADVGVGAAVVGRLGVGAGGAVVGGPVVGCCGRMITASAVPGEPGVPGPEEGLGLDACDGANGRLQSDGPPSEPVRTATPMEPRKKSAVVVPDHAAARVRNSLRPESSTKTGEPVDLSSGVDGERSARTFPLRTAPC
jgi:hypothetical protein